MDEIRHVVVLMQENRSFDHYFGMLDGVRGFGDPQALRFPSGRSVFEQPARHRPDEVLLPYRMDAHRTNAQHVEELPHDWETGHDAINDGAMDQWVAAKGEGTMGYLTRADIPYQYALADEFTLCDAYFCSLAGPTSPNRLYLWTGTVGPGRDGTTGPWIDNTPLPGSPVCDWTTYAERLSAADVPWRVYHSPGVDEREGNYEDNALEYFRQFHAMSTDDPRHRDAMTRWDLDAFDEHCREGTLPTVSWIVAPYLFCEHPSASPAYGAHFVNTALQSVFANPEIWRHTAFLVMYDENDGFFDHVVPPWPEPGTPDEFVDGQPIGLGNRVPLWVISPWSRGGWVDSQVFDHTSVLQFLERVTGVEEPNISAWRRQVCGDLTSCFDFERPDYSVPDLPDTRALMALADAEAGNAPVEPPAPGAQAMPVQPPGLRPHRPLPYRPWADARVDPGSGQVVCTLANRGSVGFHFTVFPGVHKPFAGTPYTVPAGESADYTWDARRTAGSYDFTVHGADGFVFRCAGALDDTGQLVPCVDASLADDALLLRLANRGSRTLTFEVAGADVVVEPGAERTVAWPMDAGTYDVSVAVAGSSYQRRYAGTVHAAAPAPTAEAGAGIAEPVAVAAPGAPAARDPHPDDPVTIDRNWAELLQELRVTQTGVQLLSGFLLTVPFSSRFAHLDDVQRTVYAMVFAGSVLATALLIAPVAFHRVLFRRRKRRWLVEAANRCAKAGLTLLALVSSGVIFLVFDLVGGRYAAGLAVVTVLTLFAGLWVVFPTAARHRQHVWS